MNTQHEIPADPEIRWQCRRGMLELDILLLAFFDKDYKSLAQEEKKIFIALLSFPDQELYGWLIGKIEPPFSFQAMVKQIRQVSWKPSNLS